MKNENKIWVMQMKSEENLQEIGIDPLILLKMFLK